MKFFSTDFVPGEKLGRVIHLFDDKWTLTGECSLCKQKIALDGGNDRLYVDDLEEYLYGSAHGEIPCVARDVLDVCMVHNS